MRNEKWKWFLFHRFQVFLQLIEEKLVYNSFVYQLFSIDFSICRRLKRFNLEALHTGPKGR